MSRTRLSRKSSQEQTRARLRRSAVQAFARQGIAGSRIEAIAEGAGYSRGAFYSNYASKHELLIDLLREKQIGEIELWREVLLHTLDPEADLAQLAARYDRDEVRERAMLNIELQLEADRNPDFRPAYLAYLDSAYAAIRGSFTVMLDRHGKAMPDDFDAVLVSTRLLGLGLGSASILGSEIASRATAGQVMFAFLRQVIAAAPPKDKALTHDNSIRNDNRTMVGETR